MGACRLRLQCCELFVPTLCLSRSLSRCGDCKRLSFCLSAVLGLSSESIGTLRNTGRTTRPHQFGACRRAEYHDAMDRANRMVEKFRHALENHSTRCRLRNRLYGFLGTATAIRKSGFDTAAYPIPQSNRIYLSSLNDRAVMALSGSVMVKDSLAAWHSIPLSVLMGSRDFTAVDQPDKAARQTAPQDCAVSIHVPVHCRL